MKFKRIKGFWKIRINGDWHDLSFCENCLEVHAIFFNYTLGISNLQELNDKIRCCSNPLHDWISDHMIINKFVKKWKD